jgi:L-threonylcarbamoyladenylate synthase
MSSKNTSSPTGDPDPQGSARSAQASTEGFAAAVAWLQAGELVAFPTDTVYGVGAICWNEEAVARLYTAKLRSPDKAIPILLADAADLALVAADLPSAGNRLAEAFWPGPLTLVVSRTAAVSDAVTAGGDTVAVRIPNHELTRALIRAAGAPLATTSANISGGPSPVTAAEVAAQLGGRIAMILDGGRCPGGAASTVVDVTGPTPRIMRLGPITEADILAVL